MPSLRLALACVNQTPLDWRRNQRNIEGAVHAAHAAGARIICLPELCIPGYGCEDFFYHAHLAERSLRMATQLAAIAPDALVLVGLPLFHQGQCYNAQAVLHGGQIAALIPKCHLARSGIHYEPRWFSSWQPGRLVTETILGREVPLGTQLLSFQGFLLGVEICEDAWVEDAARPCRLYGGAHWVFNASASHFSLGKDRIRDQIVASSSAKFPFGYAYANLVGNESGRAIYDGELLFALEGRIVQRSRALSLQEWQTCLLDAEYQNREGGTPLRCDARPAASTRPSEAPPLPTLNTRRVPADYDVAFLESASLALWDYLRKSHMRGFVVSLSGGVDSSITALLVWVMARRVCSELKPAERKRAWPEFPHWDGLEDPQVLVGHLLTTVYQATRHSGPATRQAASALAAEIGARHLEWDVDFLVEGYKGMVSRALHIDWNWQEHDIALQNIQARVRGPGVWMIANLQNALLLSTSNRSEVAVGYATMDGDTCGSLAPIAGMPKSYLRRLLVRLEHGQVPGYPALPSLAAVNAMNPTAELRPAAAAQTDEDDLMPYLVLDILEKLMTSDHCDPLSAYRQLIAHELGSPEECLLWTRRFFRLFASSQWKRERYAPAFHLDDQNLDPKTWARFPILNGAFAAECEELIDQSHTHLPSQEIEQGQAKPSSN